MPRIEPRLKNALDKELEKSEKLLWSGIPDASVIFSPGDIFLVPFAAVWLGFTVFWEVTVLRNAFLHGLPGPIGLIFPLWGIPFVLVGLHMLIGRFFVIRMIKQNTIYGITNKRVIVLSIWRGSKVRSTELRNLGAITKTGNDARGTLIFGDNRFAVATTGMGALQGNAQSLLGIGFFDIERPREAYDIISSAKDRALTDKNLGGSSNDFDDFMTKT